VPRRVDPEHLSRIGMLVRWLNEDVEFFRVDACYIPTHGPVGLDQIRVTVAHNYCSDVRIVQTGNGEETEPT
jgi:hypothetical protein